MAVICCLNEYAFCLYRHALYDNAFSMLLLLGCKASYDGAVLSVFTTHHPRVPMAAAGGAGDSLARRLQLLLTLPRE